MQFTQSTTVPQLYTAGDNGSAAPGTILYLLPEETPTPPAVISFDAAWTTYAGVYIFLETALDAAEEEAFVHAAWVFLADPRQATTRFAWFDQPDGSGLLTGTTLGTYTGSGGAVLTSFDTVFSFRNVALNVPMNTPVAANDATSSFTFANNGTVMLSAAWGAATISSLGAAITLPLAGSLAGCLQFSALLTQSNQADLDIALRYFYAIPPDSSNPSVPFPNGSFFLASLRYPLFSQSIQLYANLDPLGPLVPARTFFAFNGADAGQPAAPAAAPVGSWFNSTMGDAFTLAPLAGSAAPTAFASLVFAVNQLSSTPSPADPYYLVPSGDFELATSRGGVVDMMCGLSGVEYLGLAAGANIMTCFAGQPAFAEGYYPGQNPGYTTLKPSTVPTTSFVLTTASASVVDYFAQPDQSVLYNFSTQDSPEITALGGLVPVPVLASTIPWPPESSLAFPMMPYSGLSGADLPSYRQMESQVLSPARKNALEPATAVAPGGRAFADTAGTFSTTPQGLLATYSAGSPVWSQVVLAQMADSRRFQLTDVQGALLSAFQSNKMFLVVSDPASIAASLLAANALITIGADSSETWNFDIDPAVWTSSVRDGTILIIKFYDMSIANLAMATSTWASPATFNESPALTSSTITRIIDEANPADPDFAAFLNAVENPNWNGILILNATAPLDQLPAQLEGLAAGIDPALFFAHHVGINASKINLTQTGDTGSLGIDNSSIFGLINYQAPAPLQAGGADYKFQVQTLKVLFLNSTVAGFSSVIEVQINKLFGETATLQGSTDNIVRMFGTYQQHMVNGVVQDSYTFQTPSGESSTFVMTSNVINVVQMTQGQFVTVTSESTDASTLSQFLFWGLLDFKALENFDLFSFGSEADAAVPAGLNFSNLAIDMTFDPQTPEVPATFAFDAAQLAFDMAGSTTRPGSFFNHFPITLASFTQGKNGTTPSGQGYMGVQTPLTQSTLAYPWYSLNFNVNLGSPGALAAQIGFIASITAAWSPGGAGGAYTVFTGLKLPGSDGAKRQITIEGLFNITFKTLEIIAVPEGTTFILVLYGIGFSFLSFTFPPTGQVNFVLFGNPGQAADGNTSLGWYTAYAKPSTKTTGGTGRSGAVGGETTMMIPIETGG